MRGQRGARWCLVALLVGVSLVAFAAAKPGATTTTAEPHHLQDVKYSAGDCVLWHDNGAYALKVYFVDCAKPHIMEMIGVTKRISDRTLPSDARMNELISQLCTPAVEQY